jgi:phytoene dehydrogenase-like protein
MGEVNGIKGMWGHVRGGMGAVSKAIESAAIEYGAEIVTNASVKSIDVHDGRVCGVTLASGEAIEATHVLANTNPLVTMLDLIEEKELPERVVTHFRKNWNCESASTKVGDLALG